MLMKDNWSRVVMLYSEEHFTYDISAITNQHVIYPIEYLNFIWGCINSKKKRTSSFIRRIIRSCSYEIGGFFFHDLNSFFIAKLPNKKNNLFFIWFFIFGFIHRILEVSTLKPESTLHYS